MTPDWSPLNAALARLRTAHVELPLWWRDDDAITTTPALEHLTRLSLHLDLPVHLACVPKHMDRRVADFVKAHCNIVPVAHGWQHKNHAPDGAKKAEFGHPRRSAVAEISQACDVMTDAFESTFLPVFVPPWNRFDPSFLPALTSAGFVALSTFGDRRSRCLDCDLLQINTHIDPLDWRGTRGLKDPDTLIAQAATLIDARVSGEQDASEPLGYLTHHLVHDSPVWHFTEHLIGRLLDGGAAAVPAGKLLETQS